MEEKEKKTLTDAEKAKQEALASDAAKPGEYTSKWQQQLDAAMDKILNREAFSYDLNGDALYRQYKDRAVKNGRLAMMDTMGQAAAMTGGYGSSYAQSAGQQAYQKQMDTLTDQAAQLYDRARQDYDRQGQMYRDRYDILRQRENSSYNQYKQGLSSWETENQRLWDRYDSLRQQEYQAQRDLIQDQQWQAEFDEAHRQFYDELPLKHRGR